MKGSGIMARQKMTPEQRAVFEAQRAERCRQMGTLGGQKTAATYGRKYMSEIGKIGFTVYADTHHDGNRAQAYNAVKKMRDPNRNVRQPGAFRQLKEA